MMEELIPKPDSKFVKVECKNCGNLQVIFDRPAMEIKCLVCDAILAEPKGCKADIKCDIKKVYG